MGILTGTTVYLAGPVEQDDHAHSWRDSIKKPLNDLGINVWDPLCKPAWVDKSFTGKAQRNDKVELFNDRWEIDTKSKIFARNEEIRRVALRLASAADFIICKIGGPTVGTFEELALARLCLKPVLFFGTMDSSWRFVQFYSDGYQAFHIDQDSLLSYIGMVDNKSTEVSNVDWIFTNGCWPLTQE